MAKEYVPGSDALNIILSSLIELSCGTHTLFCLSNLTIINCFLFCFI